MAGRWLSKAIARINPASRKTACAATASASLGTPCRSAAAWSSPTSARRTRGRCCPATHVWIRWPLARRPTPTTTTSAAAAAPPSRCPERVAALGKYPGPGSLPVAAILAIIEVRAAADIVSHWQKLVADKAVAADSRDAGAGGPADRRPGCDAAPSSVLRVRRGSPPMRVAAHRCTPRPAAMSRYAATAVDAVRLPGRVLLLPQNAQTQRAKSHAQIHGLWPPCGCRCQLHDRETARCRFDHSAMRALMAGSNCA